MSASPSSSAREASRKIVEISLERFGKEGLRQVGCGGRKPGRGLQEDRAQAGLAGGCGKAPTRSSGPTSPPGRGDVGARRCLLSPLPGGRPDRGAIRARGPTFLDGVERHDEHSRAPGQDAAQVLWRSGRRPASPSIRPTRPKAWRGRCPGRSTSSSRRFMPAAAARALPRTRTRCQGRGAPCPSVDEVIANAREMLGNTLVTKQTGAGRARRQPPLCRGRRRHRPRALPVDARRPPAPAGSSFVASTEGGMDIETVAAEDAGKDRYRRHRPDGRRDRHRHRPAQRRLSN